MLVGTRMKHPVLTISPETSLADALKLMNNQRFRRLPVVDPSGKLLGIVTERQLLKASPSNATTLDVYEIKDAMNKVSVSSIMTRNVATVTVDTTIEEVARVMAEKKVGGVPVVDGDNVVGIITATDIFNIFLEVLGGFEPGIRVSAYIGQQPGTIAKLSQSIFEAGGNIRSLGTFKGDSSSHIEVTFKVCGIEKEDLLNAVKPNVIEIIDVRGSRSTC
jgi:acetoin utilization protein AcuB